MKEKYGCVILAGGSGKRMGGRNKAELEYERQTFAERIEAEMEALGMRCYISSAAYEQKLPDGWRLVRDRVTGEDGCIGPIGGIYSCLIQAAEDGLDGLFFAPCDAPLYNREIIVGLNRMLNEEAVGPLKSDALVWCTGDGRVQTAYGWYSVSCLPVLENDIRNGKYKLRAALGKVNCRIIDTRDAGIRDEWFININTEDEYRWLMQSSNIYDHGKDSHKSVPHIITQTGRNHMNTDNNKVVSLEEGIDLLRSLTSRITETETVSIRKALGRTIAQDITATHDQPPFARSPFDGYAIRSADSKGASVDGPVTLNVIGEVDAGHVFSGTVNEGQAVRIMTGAPIPAGADAVIKQEETDYGEDMVNIFREMRYNQNNCAAGEDYRNGTLLLPERSYIGAAEVGILASTGNTEVKVYRRPKALLLSTGDEIMMPGEQLKPGKIYDSNLFTLEAVLTEWGVDVIHAEQVEDNPDAASAIITKYADEVDLIISSGGVSVGKKDIMHDVFAQLEVARTFWKIGIKPGAAMLTGIYREKHILALSGNPYAAYVDLHMVVRPVVNALNGNDHLEMLRETVVLMDDYDRTSPIRRFIRAYVREGKAYLEGHTGGNGDIYSGHGINAMLDIPAGSDKLKAGDIVSAVLL